MADPERPQDAMPDRLIVVIYDDSRDRVYREQAVMAVGLSTGWADVQCTNPGYAIEELGLGANALIAAITNIGLESFKGKDLLLRSNVLEIPRAIITSSPAGENWRREGSSDIVIPKRRKLETVKRLSFWLDSLREQTRQPEA